MFEAVEAGFTPMAMLYRDVEGKTDYSWRQFQRRWARPAIVHGTKGLHRGRRLEEKKYEENKEK